jgi:hypothetical protein
MKRGYANLDGGGLGDDVLVGMLVTRLGGIGKKDGFETWRLLRRAKRE